MSQTLYRKYRSQTFSEIVGQQAVIKILRNSIERNRLNHAYLFTGPRGTGKTSVARIFAKALNCPEITRGDACGKCDVCTSVAGGNAVDVIEIDAASNRGIDNIRDLREKVAYTPIKFKYKVYIIDEVHMITKEGFNALLKTLEEPPAHVVFCLCTTEAFKLPITILSRCIRFDFGRLPLDDLAKHLQMISTTEGFDLGSEAATELATLAECSARDAISLLDQLMVFCDKEITSQAIRELFQLGEPGLIPRIVDTLSDKDPVPVLDTWQELVAQGVDPGRFLLQVASEIKRRYVDEAQTQFLGALEAVWQGANLLKYEGFPALLVELTLLKAQAALNPAQSIAVAAAPRSLSGDRLLETAAQPQQAVTRVQDKPELPAPSLPEESAAEQHTVNESSSAAEPEAAPVEPAPQPPDPKPVRTQATPEEIWDKFTEALKRHRLTTYGMIHSGVIEKFGNGVLELEFEKDAKAAFTYVQGEAHLAALTAAATDVLGPGVRVVLKLAGDAAIVEANPPVEQLRRVEPPDEILAEVIEEPAPARGKDRSVNPDRMERAADDMASGLGAAAGDTRPPTAQEAMNLFDATELDSEEV